MAGLDDIIKSTQWVQNIHKSLEPNSQLSEILKSHQRMTSGLSRLNAITDISKQFQQQQQTIKSLSGIGMLTELTKVKQQQDRLMKNLGGISMLTGLTKNMQKQITALSPSFSTFVALTKSMKSYSNFGIPQTTLDAIASINRQHDQLFGNLRSITETFAKNQSVFSQINNWQSAISGISGQLASIAAVQKKWDLIDDFEEISEGAVSLNERIFDENGVTKDGLNELKDFLQRIEIKVKKIDADANSLFWKLMTIIGFIIAVMSEVRVWLPQPEYATKQEVETVIKEQFTIYEKKLREDKEFRIVSRVCKVMTKPYLKSVVLEKLPADLEVTVLQIHKKWIFVSYLSPTDDLPQTGWIMKKYLDKPEKRKKGSH